MHTFIQTDKIILLSIPKSTANEAVLEHALKSQLFALIFLLVFKINLISCGELQMANLTHVQAFHACDLTFSYPLSSLLVPTNLVRTLCITSLGFIFLSSGLWLVFIILVLIVVVVVFVLLHLVARIWHIGIRNLSSAASLSIRFHFWSRNCLFTFLSANCISCRLGRRLL